MKDEFTTEDFFYLQNAYKLAPSDVLDVLGLPDRNIYDKGGRAVKALKLDQAQRLCLLREIADRMRNLRNNGSKELELIGHILATYPVRFRKQMDYIIDVLADGLQYREENWRKDFDEN